ncbi:alpha/beta hydrolase [Streptomyces parvulus]|uniref:alpha/beta hydrolase n=1 Tax=Streptomyces parvulus TaxID=146923 RepID=UPI003F4E2A91
MSGPPNADIGPSSERAAQPRPHRGRKWPRSKTLALTLAVVAVAASAVAGASAATTDVPTDRASSLKWGSCPKEAAAPRMECATLQVPLDYARPDGRQIEMAVSRLASENPSKRRGVLFTNPGGPGAAGLSYPAVLAAFGLPKEVVDSYDLIGFDPRGAGRSSPVSCDLTPEQQERGAFPTYARTAADVTREARYARTVARQCAGSHSAWMLPHTTTANTARDMDRVRAALGERRISYLGASYGTSLGAVYATLFPKRGDRIVLDSNLGPRGYDVGAFRLVARGMEERFPEFAAFVAGHPEYGLGTTPAQVTGKFYELARRLDEEPVGGVDGSMFRGRTLDGLYADMLWPDVAKTWQALDLGKPIPPAAPPNAASSMAARLYVLCADTRWPTKIRDYQRDAAVDRLLYPMLGGSTANIGPCAFWPDTSQSPVKIGSRGPSNILMVQNERDPGTPLLGAKRLRWALGHRAAMVTADEGGHGVYPFGRNTCANDAVTAFLTTGVRPAHDKACATEPVK